MKKITLAASALTLSLATFFFVKKEKSNELTKETKKEVKAKYKPFTRYNANENIAQIILENYQQEQKLSTTQTDLANWKPIANKYNRVPKAELSAITSSNNYNIAGRMMDIAFHPTDKNILFAASDTGGVWKTTDHGTTWNCISNNTPIVGVSAVHVDPQNPNSIIIGTANPSLGIYITKNGGTTWTKAAYTENEDGKFNAVTKFFRSKKNPTHILSYLRGTNLKNIFLSTNGGDTWAPYNPKTDDFKDIIMNPLSNTLYGISVDSYDGIELKKSFDFGKTWTNKKITNKFMKDGALQAQSARLAMSKIDTTSLVINFTGAEENVGTLLDKNNTITDLFIGSTKKVTTVTNPDGSKDTDEVPDVIGNSFNSFYAFVANPTNKDQFFIAGTDVARSNDGMKTVVDKISTLKNPTTKKYIEESFVHVDITNMKYSPITNELYITGDGGITHTKDHGATFKSLNGTTKGLNTIQVYDFIQSSLWKEVVLLGTQDNGSLGYSMYDDAFFQYAGGDIFYCAMSPMNDKLYALSSLGGEMTVYRVPNNSDDDYETKTGMIKFNLNNESTAAEDSQGKMAIGIPVFDHSQENRMFFGMYNIFRYDDLSGNKNIKPTKKLTNISGKGKVRFLHQSIYNASTLYFSLDSKNFYRIDNSLGATPTVADLSAKLPTNTFGKNEGPTSIMTDPTNENIVYITYKDKFYKSTDKGNTWTDFSNGLPAQIFTRQAVIDTSDTSSFKDIYVSTDTGVYINTDGTGFKPFKKGISFNFAPTKLEIYYFTPSESMLRMSTYGRGMWESPLASNKPVAKNREISTITAFPNPAKDVIYVNIEKGEDPIIKIYSINGQLVLETKGYFGATPVDIAHLAKGTYIIKTDADKNGVKFIKR